MQEIRVDDGWFNEGVVAVMDVTQVDQRSDDGKLVLGAKVNSDGLPLWKVEVAFKGEGFRKGEVVAVTVASASVPDLVGRRPVFGGVRGRPWLFDGKAGVAVSAVSFSTVDARPSSKASPPPPPPADVNGVKVS